MATIKGVKDIFGKESQIFDYILSCVSRIYSIYGFEKIDVPILEYTELFTRSIGTFTDIVQKEMFTLQDRKGRSITLRPEGTAGVIRAYLDNNFAFNPGIKKLFYYGPMFRAENPQKGRLREFHQFGCEAIGSMDPLLDAEVIGMNMELLNEVKLNPIQLEINSVGCKKCRAPYTEKLKVFLHKHENQLCENCKVRMEQNPLRVFDCKKEECQKVYETADYLTDNLCEECCNHFDKVKNYLKLKKIEFVINKRLVRGFDYYTKTVFEIKSGLLGAQNAIMGGGRYDYLIELLGGQPTPAVGVAAGIERIAMVLIEQQVPIPVQKNMRVYLGIAGKIDDTKVLSLFELFRKNKIQSFYPYNEKSLKAQLKEADKLECDYCVILGEEELKNNKIIIRDLKKGEQKEIDFNDLLTNTMNYF